MTLGGLSLGELMILSLAYTLYSKEFEELVDMKTKYEIEFVKKGPRGRYRAADVVSMDEFRAMMKLSMRTMFHEWLSKQNMVVSLLADKEIDSYIDGELDRLETIIKAKLDEPSKRVKKGKS